ncbi:hypothetical protein B2H91_06370 [Clostridium botulinum]|uniref:hypothetical protein n=1 Tax=Clostridium botulinum TaxID=1491 RepID=UPI000472969E|nr:hypothetical protein [Clostridium botulinum]AUN18188.1 hypothetical protein B2M06_11500 [Clostridium botulinum]OSA87840.1 hypothetical protein B2H91_06370 [Clostridium botulinum]
MVICELKGLFIKNNSEVSVSEEENTMSYVVKFELKGKDLKVCTKDNVKTFIENLKINGHFSIKFESENSGTLCLIQNIDDISRELDNLYDETLQEDEKLIFNMTINKAELEGKIRIYSFNAFKNTLLSLSYEKLIDFFSDCLKNKKSDFVILESNHKTYTICSNSFKIINENINYIINEVIDKDYRERILAEGNIHCINQGFNKNILIPEDFYIKSKENQDFFALLAQKLLFIITIKYISNYYRLENNNFYFKIIGYKTIQCQLNLEEVFHNKIFITNINTYYEIYKWIYKDKNIEEKIEMARNLITIYINDETLEIDKNIIRSLNSALKIYLKENVDKYIETRNSIVKEIKNLTSKTDEVVKSFVDNVKKNLLAQFTFIISVILMNIISSNSVEKLFSKEINIMIMTFVFISIIYATVHRFYIYEKEMERYEEFYNRIKECYDFLDPNDLNNILKNDKYFKKDKEYIENEVNKYYSFWIVSQFIILFGMVIIPRIL